MTISYQEAVEKTIIASEQLNQIVNGTATAEVVVEDGSKIPSVRKALVDNFYFKDPLPWQQGQSETVFNQLRKFSDGTLWYAPTATASHVIPMGATPIGDPLWKVYSLDAIPKLTPQIREALRRSYAEAGLVLVDGSFEDGAKVTTKQDVVLERKTGKGYNWQGAIPSGGKIIPAGSTPTSTGGVGADKWQDLSNITYANQREFTNGKQYTLYRAFESAVNLTQVNEAVQFSVGGIFYRWDGVFPQGGLVVPQNTPEPSPDQTGNGKYIAVLDLAIKDLYARPEGSSKIGFIQAGKGAVPRTAQDKMREAMSARDFGAVGDGVTDDSDALQAALDAQFENKMALHIPAGKYRTTKPLHIWTESEKESPTAPLVYGDGKGVTQIIKATKTKSTVANHTDIDSVLIIANKYSKDGNAITDPYSDQTLCTKVNILRMDLVSLDKGAARVDHAIWSYGAMFCLFGEVGSTWTKYGMLIKYWNGYNKFKRMEMERNQTAFEFGVTDFGSNSTMSFEDVHCNGIDGCCYSILGTATLKNCSIDGGGGVHIRIPGFDRGQAGHLTGDVTMINCHHESPAIFSDNAMFDLTYGTIVTFNSSIEVPYLNTTVNSVLCNLSRFSTIVFNNQRFGFRVGANAHKGAFYRTYSSVPGMTAADPTCRVVLQGTTHVDTEAFDVYRKLVNSNTHTIVDRSAVSKALNTSRFIQYVASSDSSRNEFAFTETPKGRSKLTITNKVGNAAMTIGACFDRPVDLTGKITIELRGTLYSTSNDPSGTSQALIGFSNSLVSDGAVGIGSNLVPDTQPLFGKAPSNYNAVDAVWYVDVSNYVGQKYISLMITGSAGSYVEIQELKAY